MAAAEFSSLALVLDQYQLGEADQAYDLLTLRCGRIRAFSRGVRQEKSKLRYALESYSLIYGDFIQTRSSGWQLINAQLDANLYYKYQGTNREVIIRLSKLLQRLLPPDEESLVAASILSSLEQDPNYVIEHYLFISAALLIELGYLDIAEVNNLLGKDDVTLQDYASWINPQAGLELWPQLNNANLSVLKNRIQKAVANSQL